MKQDAFFKIIAIDQMEDQSGHLFHRCILGQIMTIKGIQFPILLSCERYFIEQNGLCRCD